MSSSQSNDGNQPEDQAGSTTDSEMGIDTPAPRLVYVRCMISYAQMWKVLLIVLVAMIVYTALKINLTGKFQKQLSIYHMASWYTPGIYHLLFFLEVINSHTAQ